MWRWLMVFCALLVFGALLWPTLRKLGLLGLPGDVELVAYGHAFHLPIATALLISLAVAGVWRLLDRP